MKKVTLTLALGVLMTGMAWSQTDPHPRPEGPPHHRQHSEHPRGPQPEAQVAHLTEVLNLTEAQQAELKALTREREQSMQAQREAAALEMQAQMREQRHAEQEQWKAELRQLLTAEQRQAFDAMVAQHEAEMQQRRAQEIELLERRLELLKEGKD